MSALGERIKALRNEREISQKRLAELLNVHQTQISFIERGERRLSFDLACKLADTFGITVNELVPSSDTAELEPEDQGAVAVAIR